MFVRTAERGPLRSCGVQVIEPVGTVQGYTDVWGRFLPHEGLCSELRLDGTVYGLAQDRGLHGRQSYMVCVACALDAEAPDGLITLDIPPVRYALFRTTVRDLGPVAEGRIAAWLAETGTVREAAGLYDIECYPPDSGPDTVIDLWVALARV